MKPLLFDGYKFDLRLYAVLTSCDPLIVFVYPEGLTRLSTYKFDIHSTNNRVHLTNTNQQKSRQNKRVEMPTFEEVFEYIEDEYEFDKDELWKKIKEVVAKTYLMGADFICGQEQGYNITEPYATQFSGFDVMIDEDFNVYALEYNGITTDFRLNTYEYHRVKFPFMSDYYTLTGIPLIDHDIPPKEAGRVKIFDKIQKVKNIEDFDPQNPDTEDQSWILHYLEMLDRRQKFELVFPTAENVDRLSPIIERPSYKNKMLWQYIQAANENNGDLKWVEDLVREDYQE